MSSEHYALILSTRYQRINVFDIKSERNLRFKVSFIAL